MQPAQGITDGQVLRLKGNVERSYRVPTFDELYLDEGTLRGNPDLRPEDAVNFDLGVELSRARWGPVSRLRLEVVGFWNDKDGKEHVAVFHDGVAKAPLPDGRAGLVAVIDDISDVVHADRLRQLAQLARIVAHEVKNPLTPIRLWVQELEEARRRRAPDLEGLLAEACEEIGVQVDHRADIYALGLTLFCVTLALNFLALHIVQRYREQYD